MRAPSAAKLVPTPKTVARNAPAAGRAAPLACGVALLALCTGCWTPPAGQDLRRENADLKRLIEQKDAELAAQRSTIARLEEQLSSVRAVSAADMQKIATADRIQLAALSGGDDYDGQPGHDGITIYLQPVDANGDVLKIAGEARVELFDLSKPDQNRLAEYKFDADTLRGLWYGKFLTQHYTLKCPWQGAPPGNVDITVRVTFTDVLTQRVFTSQRVFRVRTTI